MHEPVRLHVILDIFQADSGGDGGDPSSGEDGGGGEGGVSPYCATTVLVRYFHLTTFLWMFVEGEQSVVRVVVAAWTCLSGGSTTNLEQVHV